MVASSQCLHHVSTFSYTFRTEIPSPHHISQTSQFPNRNPVLCKIGPFRYNLHGQESHLFHRFLVVCSFRLSKVGDGTTKRNSSIHRAKLLVKNLVIVKSVPLYLSTNIIVDVSLICLQNYEVVASSQCLHHVSTFSYTFRTEILSPHHISQTSQFPSRRML